MYPAEIRVHLTYLWIFDSIIILNLKTSETVASEAFVGTELKKKWTKGRAILNSKQKYRWYFQNNILNCNEICRWFCYKNPFCNNQNKKAVSCEQREYFDHRMQLPNYLVLRLESMHLRKIQKILSNFIIKIHILFLFFLFLSMTLRKCILTIQNLQYICDVI